MLYGAAYYHEYQPYERLEKDIALMLEMNVTVVRLGESTWSSWEPEEGRFETAWMDRIVDAIHDAGIKVIFGTPTYAIPPWLAKKHPEIMAQGASAQYVPYGFRQNTNLAHPTFFHFTERITRKLMSHYSSHPGIIGYQVDNETGHGQLYNPDVFQKFLWYLKEKYETVDRLNEVWGLTYWSHRINEWDELWKPDGNSTPAYDLEWRRFQASLVTDFLKEQIKIMRKYIRADQFITHCFVRAYSKTEANMREIAKLLDVTAVNPYHVTQAGLELDRPEWERTIVPDWMNGVVPNETDVDAIFFNGDWGRSAKEGNFIITELNANSVGDSHVNYPGYPGQLRLAAYTYISKGANMISYWHWHTLHYGCEMYWGDVLGHNLEKGRIGREFEQIAAELKQHGEVLTDLTPNADVGFLYHEDSKYALAYTPALALPNSNKPDLETYQRVFSTFYRFYSDQSAQTAIVHPDQDFEKYPLLVVPALYAADDDLLKRLVHYVRRGGHLVLTFRSGYADEFSRARWETAPGLLREAVGASYSEYSNLTRPVPVTSEQLELTGHAAATGWADALEVDSAEPLVTYEHPFFGDYPAVTSQKFGAGRLTYCGTLPNLALGRAVAKYTMSQVDIGPVVPNLPETVRVVSSRTKKGGRLLFFTNWSWTEQTLPSVAGGKAELLSGVRLTDDTRLSIEGWGIKVVVLN